MHPCLSFCLFHSQRDSVYGKEDDNDSDNLS